MDAIELTAIFDSLTNLRAASEHCMLMPTVNMIAEVPRQPCPLFVFTHIMYQCQFNLTGLDKMAETPVLYVLMLCSICLEYGTKSI